MVPHAPVSYINYGLTRLVNFLLSGAAHQYVAPWLCGATITALHKKNGWVHPVTVCETIRHLVSRVCCLVVRKDLPDLFLPWGQLGVGIKGGLEVGMRRLCRHNFGHNRYVWESRIMLAFSGDYKALTVGKSSACTIPFKKIEIL